MLKAAHNGLVWSGLVWSGLVAYCLSILLKLINLSPEKERPP